MNAHATVDRVLRLFPLHHAFDALKRSATAFLARSTAPYTSTTPSEPAHAPLETSEVVNGATPHLPGTAIVASVGLGYLTRSAVRPRLFLYTAGGPSAGLPAVSTPASSGFDIDIEPPSDDEAPHSATPTLPSAVRSSASCMSSTNSMPQSNKVSASTALSPSSSGSDSSFECATPRTAAAGAHHLQPRIQSSHSVQPTNDIPAQLTWLDVHRALDTLEDKVSKLVQLSREAVQAKYSTPSGGECYATPEFGIIYYEDDEVETSDAELGSADGESDIDDVRALTVLCNPHTGTTYTVQGVVADGGFSRVAQVVDSKGQQWAAKIMHKRAVFKRPRGRDNLLREKNIMVNASGMGTQRLVGLLESWEDEENIYFIMVSVSFDAVLIK